MKHQTWDEFFAWLKSVHWESLAPEYRIESRPRQSDADPDVPDDVWQTALLVFPDAEAWLNNPIPNQRRKTPLQLISRGGVEIVRSILMEVAPAFLPPADEVRNYSEVEAALAEARAMAKQQGEGAQEAE